MYTTASAVCIELGNIKAIQLTTNNNQGPADYDKIERAIKDFDAKIDAFTGKLYIIPFNPVPELIENYSLRGAIINLYNWKKTPSPVPEEEKNIMYQLKMIAKGEIVIPGVSPASIAPIKTAAIASYNTETRIFSRCKLRGF